jgi:class 3 adenylate cyclase
MSGAGQFAATLAAPDSEVIWLDQIDQARRLGNHLRVYDLSVRALEAFPDVIVFHYQAILALARAGAFGNARARYDKLVATGRLEEITNQRLAEDFAALDGRLWKDAAQRSHAVDATQCRLKSAEAYAAAYQRFGGFYPAINAASMFLSIGQKNDALAYATIALKLVQQPENDYWAFVTAAEACLILGDFPGAAAALRAAAHVAGDKLDEVASTRRQLEWVAQLVAAPVGTLDALVRPRVLSWVVDNEVALLDIARHFRPGQPAIAFGPVLSGADIAAAEALVDIDFELNLVLPCDPGLIVSSPICRAVNRGVERFRTLLNKANSVTLVTGEGGPFEPAARLLCRQQARGLAWLRAQQLAVHPELFPPHDLADFGILPDEPAANAIPAHLVRQPHTILFGDVRGFSQLSEAQQLLFITYIINGFAEVLDASPAVEYTETAGDGLFIVVADIVEAVRCCFALLGVLHPKKVSAAGLPEHLALRLSAHVGPLHKRYDGVIHRDRFCGMEVIRTARIEPVTPPGEIFVTEQFAASLACVAGKQFVCEYAGIQQMHKGFGECQMYSLRPAIWDLASR